VILSLFMMSFDSCPADGVGPAMLARGLGRALTEGGMWEENKAHCMVAEAMIGCIVGHSGRVRCPLGAGAHNLDSS